MKHARTSVQNNISSLNNFVGIVGAQTRIAAMRALRLCGVRERHVFTRHNKVRLRYVSAAALVCAMGIPAMVSFVPASNAVNMQMAALNNIETAAGQDSDISSLLDGSLYGQLSLASAALEAIPRPTDKIVTVEPGDALGAVMNKAGVGAKDAHEAITAMKEHFDPRRLKAGQDVKMHFAPDVDGTLQFAHMQIEMDPITSVKVEKINAGYRADVIEKEVNQVTRVNKVKIKNSLFGAAEAAGIPQGIITEAIKIYSWNVDFQRDIRQGDTIEVMYDNYETDDGYVAKPGNILYAKLTVGGKDLPLYRYEMANGRVDYFGPDGRSIKRTLMKTPINGARLSSGFGLRRHPVLGYNKMHKGVDFAASTGTPIYAAGDGRVEYASRFSSYGNYVRIRHNSTLKTAYAHMHTIKVKNGQYVKQGDVIGTVGTTGRSTGPHLHYEVMVNGAQVNPRSVNLPTGEELAGKELKDFKARVRDADMRFAKLADGINVASNTADGRYN